MEKVPILKKVGIFSIFGKVFVLHKTEKPDFQRFVWTEMNTGCSIGNFNDEKEAMDFKKQFSTSIKEKHTPESFKAKFEPYMNLNSPEDAICL